MRTGEKGAREQGPYAVSAPWRSWQRPHSTPVFSSRLLGANQPPISIHILLNTHTPPVDISWAPTLSRQGPVPRGNSIHDWPPIRTGLCACWCFPLFKSPVPSGGAVSTSRAGVRPHLHPVYSGCSGELLTLMEKPEEVAQSRTRSDSGVKSPGLES